VQPDLAGRGERAAGLGWLRVEEGAAPGGLAEAPLDFAGGQGGGGGQGGEVAGGLAQLVVAPTRVGSGTAAELAGQRAAGPRVPQPDTRRRRHDRQGGGGGLGAALARAASRARSASGSTGSGWPRSRTQA